LTFDSGISYRGPESVFAQDIYGGISSVGRRGGARQGKAGSGWGREAGSGGVGNSTATTMVCKCVHKANANGVV